MPTGIPLTRGQIQDFRNKAALHAATRQRVLLLEAENAELKRQLEQTKAENKQLQEKLQGAEETIKRQEDANQKLRAMLFKTHRHRTKRTYPPKPRTRRQLSPACARPCYRAEKSNDRKLPRLWHGRQRSCLLTHPFD